MNPRMIIGVTAEASFLEIESAYVEKFNFLSRGDKFDAKGLQELVNAFDEIRKHEIMGQSGLVQSNQVSGGILSIEGGKAGLLGGKSSTSFVPEYMKEFPPPSLEAEFHRLHTKLENLETDLCGLKVDVEDIKKVIVKENNPRVSAAASIAYLPRILSGGILGLKSVLLMKRIGSRNLAQDEGVVETIGGNTAQASHQTVHVPITLEEVHTGVFKRVRVTLKVQFPEGFRKINRYFYMEIVKGAMEGEEITRLPQIIEELEKIAGDLVFVVQEKPHPVFERDGHDLKYNITVKKDLEIGSILIDTIDGTIQNLVVPDEDEAHIVVEGKGLPMRDNPTSFGNLVINFKKLICSSVINE